MLYYSVTNSYRLYFTEMKKGKDLFIKRCFCTGFHLQWRGKYYQYLFNQSTQDRADAYYVKLSAALWCYIPSNLQNVIKLWSDIKEDKWQDATNNRQISYNLAFSWLQHFRIPTRNQNKQTVSKICFLYYTELYQIS